MSKLRYSSDSSGGVLVGNTEIAFELSPFTYVPGFGYFDTATLQGNLTVGYYAPLSSGSTTYWPVRFGVGFLALNLGQGAGRSLGFFQARADLFNVAFDAGITIFEFQFPSYRFSHDVEGVGLALHHWRFGFSVLLTKGPGA